MLIIGAKGFAKEVLEDVFQDKSAKEIVFFDNVSTDIGVFLFDKFKVLKSFEEAEKFFLSNERNFTAGIGGPLNRYQLSKQFLNMGGLFTSTISMYSQIGTFGTIICEGCNIMAGVKITNSIKIGRGTLVNLNCTIGHDSIVGQFVEMSPGTRISGNCKIGDYSVLGTNSTVLPKVSIDNNVVVGAGAVVTKDVPSNCLVVGVPAKIIKELPPLGI